IDARQIGHQQIEQKNVRMELLHLLDRSSPVLGFADHLKVGRSRESGAHDLAHNRIVIGEQDRVLLRCWNSRLAHQKEAIAASFVSNSETSSNSSVPERNTKLDVAYVL